MTYLVTKKFKSLFPGPFDVRRSTDGVDETFEVYCLTTDQLVVANYFWEAESERFQESLAMATALNVLLHEGLVCREGADSLELLLGQHPGPYRMRRARCNYRGGLWEVYSQDTNVSLVQCYGGPLDYNALVVGLTLRQALSSAEMVLPREKKTGSAEAHDLILF